MKNIQGGNVLGTHESVPSRSEQVPIPHLTEKGQKAPCLETGEEWPPSLLPVSLAFV